MGDTSMISHHPTVLLVREHELLGSLLDAYQDLSPGQVREKNDLFRKIQGELRRHVATEETLFYPALLESTDPRIPKPVEEAFSQHRALESLAANLCRMGPGENFDLLMALLRSKATSHMEFEERNIFPLAWLLPSVSLKQLGLEIEERQMHDGNGPADEGLETS